RRGGRSQLRHHLCNGQGCDLLPCPPPARRDGRGGLARLPRGAARRFSQSQGARTWRNRAGSQGVVSPRKRSIGIPRAVLLAVALILPAAGLIPLGSLWLWQNGLILYWAIISCIVVAGIYYFERRLLTPPAALPALEEDTSPGDTRWSPRQDEAW